MNSFPLVPVDTERYGFDNGPKLKAYVERVSFLRLAEAVRAGDFGTLRKLLKARPELAKMDLSENSEHRGLDYVVFIRSPKMVRLLMKQGADARTWAEKLGHAAVLKLPSESSA